jgi:hypothetical protein
MPEQLQFPFASLDFPADRTAITVKEFAAKVNYTEKHVADLIAEGALGAIDGRGLGASRGSYRIPIENYRKFILERLTVPAEQARFLAGLPAATKRELIRELQASLSRPAPAPAPAALACGTSTAGCAPAPSKQMRPEPSGQGLAAHTNGAQTGKANRALATAPGGELF